MNILSSGNLIETTEAQRVQLYARGWNDAQRKREKLHGQPFFYYMGYLDALRGAENEHANH